MTEEQRTGLRRAAVNACSRIFSLAKGFRGNRGRRKTKALPMPTGASRATSAIDAGRTPPPPPTGTRATSATDGSQPFPPSTCYVILLLVMFIFSYSSCHQRWGAAAAGLPRCWREGSQGRAGEDAGLAAAALGLQRRGLDPSRRATRRPHMGRRAATSGGGFLAPTTTSNPTSPSTRKVRTTSNPTSPAAEHPLPRFCIIEDVVAAATTSSMEAWPSFPSLAFVSL